MQLNTTRERLRQDHLTHNLYELLEENQEALRLRGASKNGPFSDLLSMAPDVSLVRRGLFGAISGFLPPDAQVGA